jgi:hypothetical protein
MTDTPRARRADTMPHLHGSPVPRPRARGTVDSSFHAQGDTPLEWGVVNETMVVCQ